MTVSKFKGENLFGIDPQIIIKAHSNSMLWERCPYRLHEHFVEAVLSEGLDLLDYPMLNTGLIALCEMTHASGRFFSNFHRPDFGFGSDYISVGPSHELCVSVIVSVHNQNQGSYPKCKGNQRYPNIGVTYKKNIDFADSDLPPIDAVERGIQGFIELAMTLGKMIHVSTPTGDDEDSTILILKTKGKRFNVERQIVLDHSLFDITID